MPKSNRVDLREKGKSRIYIKIVHVKVHLRICHVCLNLINYGLAVNEEPA